MRGGVLQLARWGLLARVMAAGTPEIRLATFHYGTGSTRVDIRPEHGVGYLCAPRRALLDRVLVDAAREAGADGRRSPVARRVGAQATAEGASSSAYVYGYYADMADDGYHWYFESNTAAGVIPTNDGAHCVFVGVPQDRFAATFRGNPDDGFLRMAPDNSPALGDDIAKARRVGRLRGFDGGAGYLRQCHGPGWALVGDAGYFKDPLTAHGITDAMKAEVDHIAGFSTVDALAA